MGKGNRLATLLLQFDFNKAFDKISLSRLLAKLKGLGFSEVALSWFWLYICGRSQCVFSRSSTSKYRNINLGVPQGSVLGPLLFCLYINDLKKHLDNSIVKILYADDLQIYVHVPFHEIERGINLLSEAAKKVAAWARLNCLTVNTMKTKAIVFGSSHSIRLFKCLKISSIVINNLGEQVQFVNEVVSLGIVLDSTVSWEP